MLAARRSRRASSACSGAAGFWMHLTIILTFLNFLPLREALPRHHRPAQRLLPAAGTRAASCCPRRTSRRRSSAPRRSRDLTWKQGLDLYTLHRVRPLPDPLPDVHHRQAAHAQGREPGPEALDLGPPGAGGARARRPRDGQPSCRRSSAARSRRRRSGPAPPAAGARRACPVFIENVPRLIDMRRYKVQVEADFPPEIAARLRGHGAPGQPLGHRPGPARRVGGGPDAAQSGATAATYEYLFFVGCAGSYDDRQKKVSRALVKILREAGVSLRHARQAGDVQRRLGAAAGQRVPVPDAGEDERRERGTGWG